MVHLLKTIAAAGLLTLSSIATAMPISGDINFTGLASYNVAGGEVSEIAFTNTPEVLSASGSFSSVAISSPVTIPNNPFILANLPLALWSVGGFTFELKTVAFNAVTNSGFGQSASVSGYGTISKAGYDDTSGIWGFTSQSAVGDISNGEFSFSAVTVPEPGTIALLGMALIGFGVARRQRS